MHNTSIVILDSIVVVCLLSLFVEITHVSRIDVVQIQRDITVAIVSRLFVEKTKQSNFSFYKLPQSMSNFMCYDTDL